MTILFAVLDGVAFGCCLAVLPRAVQDILDSSGSSSPGTGSSHILLALMLCSFLFHMGKACTSFLNTLSLAKSSAVSVLLLVLCLAGFAFSSSVGWLLCLRLSLGLLSGYLGYFFDQDRAHSRTRISWGLAAGLAAFFTSALYPPSPSQQQADEQEEEGEGERGHRRPLLVALLGLAAAVLVFFVLLVFAEKFGFVDDEDERAAASASYSYMPVSE